VAKSLEETTKEAEKIYAEAMAKIQELRVAHQAILDAANARVKKKKLDEIMQSMKGA
jgi:mevalonate kinase